MVVSYFFATPIINYAELFREQSSCESPNGYFKGGKKR